MPGRSDAVRMPHVQTPAIQVLTVLSLFQGCNGAHDEDPTDGAGVVKQLTDFILLLM